MIRRRARPVRTPLALCLVASLAGCTAGIPAVEDRPDGGAPPAGDEADGSATPADAPISPPDAFPVLDSTAPSVDVSERDTSPVFRFLRPARSVAVAELTETCPRPDCDLSLCRKVPQDPGGIGAFVHCPPYTLTSDSNAQGAPRGTVTKHALPSDVYGDVRDYWVYVPAQYNPATPVPLMIFFDGDGFMNTWVRTYTLDNLIARKDLPVMIVVFIAPGPAPGQRSIEYDSIDDRLSRMLVDELIPALEARWNLIDDPRARGVGGQSSGGPAALTVGWHRPDKFHRIESHIGTYWQLQTPGADNYWSKMQLVANGPKRDLRIYLQDGHDNGNTIGHRTLAKILAEKGYELQAVLDAPPAGHDWYASSAFMPESLRWLWWTFPR